MAMFPSAAIRASIDLKRQCSALINIRFCARSGSKQCSTVALKHRPQVWDTRNSPTSQPLTNATEKLRWFGVTSILLAVAGTPGRRQRSKSRTQARTKAAPPAQIFCLYAFTCWQDQVRCRLRQSAPYEYERLVGCSRGCRRRSFPPIFEKTEQHRVDLASFCHRLAIVLPSSCHHLVIGSGDSVP